VLTVYPAACYFERMRILFGALLLAPLLAAQQDARTATLSNGMKVIVQEDHAIPNVAMYFFYKIGSRNERPGTTGISHFFEHMMFNGAKKYGPKQFDKMMDNSGGNNNAYTSNDVTVYTDWFPSSAVELMFDMEADRIRDLAFDTKIIESERGVVYSERRSSVDNSNAGMLRELAYATAFIAHPYHWPVVGWPSDIEGWSMDDLKTHFRMGYAPNNCTLVMVGDVTFDQIIAYAKKYLEPIPRQEPPPPVRTKEPVQQGERRVTLSKPAQLAMQQILYHVPETRSPDTPVLRVFQTLLSQGQSSRLYKKMVDGEQLALSVNGFVPNALDPTIFAFFIQPRSGVDLAATEKAVYDELARLQMQEVPPAELRKAKNQILANLYRQMKTIEGRANLLGTYDIFEGDYNKLFKADQAIEAVTAGDIQRVARLYFRPTNRTVATLIPEKPEVKQ
jgi:zinc protease